MPFPVFAEFRAVAGVLPLVFAAVTGVPAVGRFPGGGVRDSCLLAEKPVFVAVRGLVLLALVAACVSGAIVGFGKRGLLAGVMIAGRFGPVVQGQWQAL